MAAPTEVIPAIPASVPCTPPMHLTAALLRLTATACRMCVVAAAAPCERFAEGPGLPPCKVNELRWCQTDLAANVYSWPRFIADDMRFGVLDSGSGANHDGYMADVVRARNWKVGSSGALEEMLCMV